MKHKYLFLLIIFYTALAHAQPQRVVDIATREGITQRILLLNPPLDTRASAAVILFAGGDGGIEISADGGIKRGGNFLVRSRELFAAPGLAVAVIDAPSDRRSPSYLDNFRQTPEHVTDVKAVIAWLKQELKLPVWLIGTSNGTRSVAHIASQLPPQDGGADGLVLTSTVLSDRRRTPVPVMALNRIQVPVLVVHHRLDSCRACLYADLPQLTDRLKHLKKTETLIFDGGISEGDACGPRAYHGYNGIEGDVVNKIAAWIKGH